MDRLYETMDSRLKRVPIDFTRYIYDRIKWENRMLGLVGPRGVGKTTLFLQRIKMAHDLADTLYVSADDMWFIENRLVDLADAFSKNGGRYLFVDEVHKYENWSRELKQIYDAYPDMHIYFTGSSVLDIHKGQGDLSRRAPVYTMQGLSFREYLSIREGVNMQACSLDEIISGHASIPGIDHPLPLFKSYLESGYYPFGDDVDFEIELNQVIERTMVEDIPQYANMNASTGRKLKHLLMVIARSVPFKPNMSSLAQTTGAGRNHIADYLLYMEMAGMIAQLRDDTGGIRGIGKVEKIYLDNPNLCHALALENVNSGNMRETFFCNQMRVNHDLVSSSRADFRIGALTFEIGGSKKGQSQIAGIPDSYIVKDNIESGHGNVIPLWAFGLNY